MYIGPTAINTLESSGKTIETFRNPIFELNQGLIDDAPANIIGGLDKLVKPHIGGIPHATGGCGGFHPTGGDSFSS